LKEENEKIKSTYLRKKPILGKQLGNFRRQNHMSEQQINMNLKIIEIKLIKGK